MSAATSTPTSATGAPDAGAAPLDALRVEARRAFERIGWPSKRLEAWKNVSARPLPGFGTSAAPRPDAPVVEAAVAAAGGAGRIVLVDGHVVQVPDALPAGVTVTPLADAGADALAVLGTIAPAGDEPLVALNQSLLPDALVVEVARGAVIEPPLELVHVAAPLDGATPCHPRVLVRTGATAEVTLVERYVGLDGAETFTNPVTELAVGPDSTLRHVVVVAERDESFHTGCIAARVDRGGHLASHVVSLSGRIGRTELHVDLAAPGAACTLDGLYLAAGDSTLDHYTKVVHAAPHTNSDERYKGVIDDKAVGGFLGRVLIVEGARGSETHQLNNNLLLSRGATAQTRPQLEIDNDDVAATHGATVGQLDEAAVFYLQTRGIDEPSARALLTWAFASEMVARLPDADLRTELGAVLAERLTRGATGGARAAIEETLA